MQVTGIRYVTPLREGGSLPGVVEADDLGTYVAKFRGAGQGLKALIAEVISGELARRFGLGVPQLVVLAVDPVIGRAEPDQEVQELLRGQRRREPRGGLPARRARLRPVAAPGRSGPRLAGALVDAYTENVDRSWRNPNLLMWHGELWLIDHGATLYFHHNWPRAEAAVRRAYRADDHVLAPYATRLEEADAELAAAGHPRSCSPRCSRWCRGSGWPARSSTTPARPGRRTWTTAPPDRRTARPGCPRERAMREPFEYAVIRVVPRVERGEQINVGRGPLLPEPRLPGRAQPTSTRSGSAPSPGRRRRRGRRDAWARGRRSRGGPEPARRGDAPGERFGWLTAPRSTIVQAGPVHTGLDRRSPPPSSTG